MKKKYIKAINLLTKLLIENENEHQLEIKKLKTKLDQIECLIENASNRK